jgi:hypothetical protein
MRMMSEFIAKMGIKSISLAQLNRNLPGKRLVEATALIDFNQLL